MQGEPWLPGLTGLVQAEVHGADRGRRDAGGDEARAGRRQEGARPTQPPARQVAAAAN